MPKPNNSKNGASKEWVYKALFDIDVNDIDYTVDTYSELPTTPTGAGLILAKVETATGSLWSKKKAGIYEYLTDKWYYRSSGYNIPMATDAEIEASSSSEEARRFSVDQISTISKKSTYKYDSGWILDASKQSSEYKTYTITHGLDSDAEDLDVRVLFRAYNSSTGSYSVPQESYYQGASDAFSDSYEGGWMVRHSTVNTLALYVGNIVYNDGRSISNDGGRQMCYRVIVRKYYD